MDKNETRKRALRRRPEPKWNEKPKVMFVIGLVIGLAVLSVVMAGSMDDGPFEDIFEDDEEDEGSRAVYTRDFAIASRTWKSNGSNEFWILEPGYRMTLEGTDDGEELRLQITILNDTYTVGGIEARVYEEREWLDGELIEVSRNWMAIDVETNSVFYFGEAVDDYENGEIVSHEGEWEHGVDGAKAGLMMPGLITLGSAYYQEVAPGVAMDRAKHAKVDVTMTVPAGTFNGCLKVAENNPLEDDETEYKTYAPGVGLIQDEEAKLVSYGYIW